MQQWQPTLPALPLQQKYWSITIVLRMNDSVALMTCQLWVEGHLTSSCQKLLTRKSTHSIYTYAKMTTKLGHWHCHNSRSIQCSTEGQSIWRKPKFLLLGLCLLLSTFYSKYSAFGFVLIWAIILCS